MDLKLVLKCIIVLCMNEWFDGYGLDVRRCCENCVQIFSGDDCLNHD